MAPLDWKTIQLPFGAGLAEKIAPALIPAGKLQVAENAIISKDGSIEQRPGTAHLGLVTYSDQGSGRLDSARHLIPDGRSTLLTTPYVCHTYQETDDRWRTVAKSYEADTRRVIHGIRNHSAHDSNYSSDALYHSGWICMAWASSVTEAFYVRFIDYETEAVSPDWTWAMDSSQSLDHVRVVGCGAYIHVFWYDRAATAIKAATFDIASLEAGPTHSIVGDDAATDQPFDAVAVGSHVYLVYYYDDGAGTTNNRVVRMDCDLGNAATKDIAFRVSGTPVTPSTQYGIDVDPGEQIYVAYTTTGGDAGVDVFSVDDDVTMAIVFGATEMDNGVTNAQDRIGVLADSDLHRALVVWDQRRTGSVHSRRLRASTVTNAGVCASVHMTYHVGLLSRPWKHNGDYYCVGFVHEAMAYAYGDVSGTAYQRNAYILQLRLGTVTELID